MDDCDNVIIQNCTIHDCSRRAIKFQGDAGIITNSSILNNSMYNFYSEYAIQINGIDADHTSTGNLVEGNTLYDVSEKGSLLLRYADSNIFRRNTCSGTEESNVDIQRSDSNQFYYNLLDHDGSNNNDYQFYIYDGSLNNEIYNNVLVNNGNDGGVYCSADSTGTKFKNNIYTGSGRAIIVADGAQVNFESDNNCLYVSGGNIAGWRGSNYATLALYQAASSQDAASIATDPLMVDPSSDDFTLQFGSPCINRGAHVGLFLDYRGTGYPVPIGHRPDIGAYEHKNGGRIF